MSKFETPEDANPVVLDKDGYDIANPIVVTGTRPVPNRPEQSRFNIDSFRSEFSRDNSVSTHSYLVSFAPFNHTSATAKPLNNFIYDSSSVLTMRCDTAILPGVRLMKDETIRRYGYGPIERVPYSAQFNEITLNWILDGRGELIKFFDDWMHSIVNYDSAGGRDMRTGRRIGNISYSPYELGYKDDYSNPKMSIVVYDRRLKQVVVYDVYDVFPSAINDVPIAWGEQDTLLKYSIELSYTDMNVSTPQTTDILTEEARSILFDDSGIKSQIYRGSEGIFKLF